MTDREEWLQSRKRILGGTDVAAILGKSKWRTPYDVWADKTGRITQNDIDPVLAERGNRLERPIAEWWLAHNGYETLDAPGLLVGREGWNGGTPDFLAYATDKPTKLLEIKTAKYPWPYGPPEDYEIQTKIYLGVLDELGIEAESGDVVGLVDMEFVQFTIWHDPEWYETVKDFARDWWYRHIVADVAPDVDAADEHTVTKVFNRPTDASVELDPGLYSVLETWEMADTQEALYASQAAKAKAQIKAALGNATVGTVDGRQVVSWLPDKNGKRTLRSKRK